MFIKKMKPSEKKIYNKDSAKKMFVTDVFFDFFIILK